MYEKPTVDGLMAMKSVPFAHFSALGTWVSKREPCEACGWHWQDYGPPLLVKWEPSTDVIGDFSWDGPFGYVFIVQQHVAEVFRTMPFECDCLDVEFVPPAARSGANCVPFPYRGPKLVWGRCDTFVDLDMEASKVALTRACPICGDVRHTFRNEGIVIRRDKFDGQRMFRITTNGRSLATFVTEDGRRLIEHARFSNINFQEAGEIVD